MSSKTFIGKILSARALVLVLALIPFALFQNCGESFKTAEESAGVLSSLKCADPGCDEAEANPDEIPVDCVFNGQTIPNGSSVVAYLAASGTTCSSEVRTCSNGSLSGSYLYGSCLEGVSSDTASCLFNGKTIAHGSAVTAYKTSSVANGESCQAESRVCSNGALSGTFTFASCSVNAPASCLFNGQTIPHNGSVKAYQSGSVAFGASCASEDRFCVDGRLTGSYAFGSCVVGNPSPCLFNGQTIPHGGTVKAYQSSSVAFGSSCTSQTRTCNNGILSGSYDFGSCAVNAAASCLFNGQTIPSGSAVIAFQQPNVPFGDSCRQESRLCSNGALSGSYAYASCKPAAPMNCSLNGVTILHGASIVAYQSSTVTYGHACAPQIRSCHNGVLSGSSSFPTCTVSAP